MYVLYEYVFYVYSCFEFAATCKNADKQPPMIRSVAKCCGKLGLGCLSVVFTILGALAFLLAILALDANYDSGTVAAIMTVFSVNYVTGVIFAWFLIDLVSMTISFKNEWQEQKGLEPDCCIPLLKLCHFNMCCCASFCCCWCVCYYCCCSKNCNNLDERQYPKDANGNVIGSQDGLFAVRWQDYEHYKNNEHNLISQSQRDWNPILDEIGGIAPNNELRLRSVSATPQILELQVKNNYVQTTATGTAAVVVASGPNANIAPVAANTGTVAVVPQQQVAMGATGIGGGDTNGLPQGWEAKKAQDGRIFFVNHNNQSTSWDDPRPLPQGWRMGQTEDGKKFFINDETKSTSWQDPRKPIEIA